MRKFFTNFCLGTTSWDFYHYIKLTLQDLQTDFDIAILHVSINDILNVESNAETISSSILQTDNQCRNYWVKDVFILSLTCSTLTKYELINNVNNAMRNKCETSGYIILLIIAMLQLRNFGRAVYT